MANNSEQFVLEISAKLKNDANELTKTIKGKISEIEKSSKINLDIDDKKLKDYLEKLKSSMAEINKAMNSANVEAQATSFVKFVDVLKEGSKYSKEISDNLYKANQIASNLHKLQKINNSNNGKSSKKLTDVGKQNKSNYESEIKSISNSVETLKKKVANVKMPNKFINDLKSIEKLSKVKINFNNTDVVNKQLDKIKGKLENVKLTAESSLDKYNRQIANRNNIIDSKYNKYDLNYNKDLYSSNKNYAAQIDNYNKKVREYKATLDTMKKSNDTAFDSTKVKSYETELNNLNNILKSSNFKNAIDVLPPTTTIEEAKKKLQDYAKVQKDLTLNSYSMSEQANGIVKLTANYKDAEGQVRKITFAYNDATKAITKLNTSNKQFTGMTKGTMSSLGSSAKEFANYMMMMTGAFYKLREGVTIVRDLDTALTEMQKVSNESIKSLQEYAQSTFEIANNIGTTGLALQQSTGDWMRLGKSMEEASKLASDTSLLMNVSEFKNVDDATESMVSMTQAYQELTSSDIVDKLNLTGNNYSIATDELAQSLQKSSSALKTAKNDFDEAIALTVAGNSVVQNPDSVAAGVRTIALRMSGTSIAKDELESMGEEVDSFLTKSKLNDTLERLTNIDKRGGISLLDDNGNYRSTAQVLIDLADRWEDIGKQDVADGENRQNALLEALAGKNRSNILASILNDKTLLKDVYEDVSTNYKGSAIQENEKYMESIEGHVTSLTNKWQEFWASDSNREFVNSILDLAKGFIDLIDGIGGAKTALALFFTVIAKKTGLLKSVGGLLSNLLTDIFTTGGISKSTGIVKNKLSGVLSNGVIGAMKDTGLIASLKNLGTFLFTTPLGLAGVGVAVVSGISKLYKNYIKDLEKSSENSKNELLNFENEKKELDDFKKSIPELAKEYDKLKNGVNSSGENINLTTDEFERYNEITTQISEMFPSLISGYDSTGKAIVKMKDSLGSLNEEYDKSLQKAALEKLENSPLSDSTKAIKKANIDLSKSNNKLEKDLGFNKFTFGGMNENAVEFGNLSKDLKEGISSSVSDEIGELFDFEFLTKNIGNYGTSRSMADAVFSDQLKDVVKSVSFSDEDYRSLIDYFNQFMNVSKNEEEIEYVKKLKEYFQKEVPKYKKATNQKIQDMLVLSQSKDEYYDLDEEQRVLYDEIVKNFSEDSYDKYSGNDGKNIEKFLKKYTKYVNTSKGKKNISKLENYQDEFFGKGTSVTEGNKNINKELKQVAADMGVTTSELEKSFDIDTSSLKKVGSDIIEFKNNVLMSESGAIIQAPDSNEKALKKLQDKYDISTLNKISENLDLFNEEDFRKNYEENFKDMYDSYENFFVDYVDSMSKMSDKKLYSGTSKSFDDLIDVSGKYSSSLAYINSIGGNNIKITNEMAESLKLCDDEFSNYLKTSKDGTGYIVTNTEAMKQLIAEKQKEASIDAKNSKNEARKQYTDLTNSLVDMTDVVIEATRAGMDLDDSIYSNIDATKSQLFVLDQTIQKYQQLETKLLGATTAFDVYNKAVEADAENNTFEQASTMMESIREGFKTGKMGTETFKASIQGILSDDTFNKLMDIDNVKTRVEKMKSLYDTAKKYFTEDSEGNPTSKGIQNFVNDAYDKKLFTSKDLDSFDVKSGVTIDDFVEKLGYSKELIFSIFENINSYNVDWGDNIFEALTESSGEFDKLSKSTENATENMQKYNDERLKYIKLLSKTDKDKDPEKWKKYNDKIVENTKNINKERKTIKDNDKKTSEFVTSYFNKQSEKSTLEVNLDAYTKQLKKLEAEYDKIFGKGNPEAESKKADEINKLKSKIESTTTALSTAVSELDKLGEPTTVELELSKTKFEAELKDLQKQKSDLEKKLQSSDLTDGARKSTEKKLENTKTKIKELEAVISGINTTLGIEAEDTEKYNEVVAEVTATKEELGMPVEFTVSTNTADVQKQLDDVLAKQNSIDDEVTITYYYKTSGEEPSPSPSPKPTKNPKKPKKKSKALGNAYANGKTLVGEFGAETIVDPWDGSYQVVGKHGAELLNHMPKDAIVFNHKQTEELFKNGKISSRGKLAPNPSSFMRGFANASPTSGKAYSLTVVGGDSSYKSAKEKSKSKNSKNSKDTKSLVDDLFDWIEIRLERLSNKTQKWITLAENAISKSVQKSHYTSAISAKTSEISQNQTAKDKYLAQANALIKKSGVKNASAYAKKVRDGSLSIQSITNEKVKDFVSSYKEMYDKAVECSNAVMSLTGELQELSQTLYNVPIEHANKKVEKYSDKMDVLSAKYETYRGYGTQNANLDEQTKLQNSIKNAYASAYTETKSNLKSAKSKINSTSDKALKGLTSAQKKKIVANVQAGKEVNISNSYSASLKKALANYNAALEANRVASNESAKASAEYTKVLRDNTNAKYENITAFYEQNRSLNEARISRANARLSYNEAVGFSAVSDEQRGAFKDQIDYNKNILNHYLSERALYDKDKLKKQYENGKLSREDYFSLLSHIEELDEGIYDTTVAIEEAKKEIFNLNITRLDYIIDGIARAMERFKNIISLKEARDEDIDESYFVSQNESLIEQIERINEKRLDYIERMKDYDPESKEYQDLATKLAEADNEAMAKFIELEENKDEMVHNRLKKVDEAIDKLNTVGDDIEHLRDLLSDDELIDNNGVFTDSGLAEIALVGELIDNNNQKIKDYKYALEKLEENFKNGNLSPDEYEEKSREFIKGIQDSVKAIDSYNDSLVDLYSKQLEIENDSLKEVIENRKKALQSKKSYYDYDKTLKSANKDIVSLKNQIAALEGVGNAAAKAEVERLKTQLSEAETELEDTKYEHTVELQLSGYEEMSNSADKALNDLLDDLKTNAQLQEEVVSNMLDNVVKNYETAYAKIQKTINSTEIGDGSFNSISKDGDTFSTSVNKSYNDKNTSYGNIETSTINIGNQNTIDIESSISGYQPSSNTTVNSINASTDNVKVTVGGNPATVTCDPRPVTATDRTISAKASSSKVSVKVKGLKVIITGKSAGNCEVKITANDSGGKSQTISVVVEAAATPTPNSGSGGGKKDVVPAVDKKTETPKAKEKKSTAGYISSLSPIITSSSSSAYIKKVQTALNGIGVKGKDGKKLTVDGKWGTNTDYAVKSFQKSSKWGGSIAADGKIGSKTKLKFKKAGYYKGGIVDNVITNTDFLNMIRMNNDDGLITAKLGEGIIPKNLMPNFASQIEKFNSLPADKIINSISNNAPNLNIQIDKFMDVQGNVDKNCVNDIRNLQNDITNNITKTLTQEFRKLGYK